MGRTRIDPLQKATASGISLPPELIDDAKRHARDHGLTLSGYVRFLLRREIKAFRNHPSKPAQSPTFQKTNNSIKP